MDLDNEDGIISATCYHGESLSITMNPAGKIRTFLYAIEFPI